MPQTWRNRTQQDLVLQCEEVLPDLSKTDGMALHGSSTKWNSQAAMWRTGTPYLGYAPAAMHGARWVPLTVLIPAPLRT